MLDGAVWFCCKVRRQLQAGMGFLRGAQCAPLAPHVSSSPAPSFSGALAPPSQPPPLPPSSCCGGASLVPLWADPMVRTTVQTRALTRPTSRKARAAVAELHHINWRGMQSLAHAYGPMV